MKAGVRQVRRITAEEFEKLNPCRRVIVHEHARRFGVARATGSPDEIGLSWRSDTVEPVLVIGSRSEMWLAIDQRVACISDDGRVVVSLGLASYVLDVRAFAEHTVVVCETEAIIFNNDCSIREIRAFTDLPGDVLDADGKLVITFTDGRKEVVE